LRSGSLIAK
jgi:hypothetical protein